MSQRIQEKLRSASLAYEQGYTCAQAVFRVYAEELGIPEDTACRMMEGFGNGVGGSEGICGVIAAASMILSFYQSDGRPCENGHSQCCKNTSKLKEIFQREYGGTTCREIMQGEEPTPLCCGMKVKDMILLIEQMTAGSQSPVKQNKR